MKFSLRATTPADLEPVRRLLRSAFNAREDAPFLNPAVMRWKYWDQRDDWDGPRGYVLERDGTIAAHVGIYPVTFGEVRGVQMIDWASAKEAAGAGLRVLQRLDAMFDFIYSIGGSEMTCQILPAYGFKEHSRQWRGGRPLRPLRQIVTHQHRNWKLAARLARNTAWALSPRSHFEGWTAAEIGPGDLHTATDRLATPRTPAFFEYLLRCPVMKVRLYEMRDQAGSTGHFALGVLHGQARVAGMWLNHANRETWESAWSLAQRTASRIADAYEMAGGGTEGTAEEAAVACGIRIVRHVPVYLLNKKGKLSLPPDFQFQLCDDDAFFWDAGQPSYWT